MTCTKRLAGALLVLLTVSGCVSRSASLDSAPASGPPVPERKAPPTAADGTDVEACADGNCEVLIESSTTVPVPGGTLSLTLAGGDRVEYEVNIKGSKGSGSAEGNCVSTFTLDGTGSGSTCYAGEGPTPDPEPRPGEMAMVIAGQDSGSAVLVLVTG
jgi:hypothetical protein